MSKDEKNEMAANTATSTDVSASLMAAARELLPRIAARADATAAARVLPGDTVTELRKAGVFAAYSPRRYGGGELEWSTLNQVPQLLGTACTSTAWIVSVSNAHNLAVGRLPKELQDDAYAEGPDVIVAMCAAGKGELEPVEGGYRLKGLWRFASGIDHADWLLVGVRMRAAEVAKVEDFAVVLVSPRQGKVLDTWRSTGLRGTGSNDFQADGIFIPAHHMAPISCISAADPPGASLHSAYAYKVEYIPYLRACLLGPLLGAANGALASYIAQTRKRVGNVFSESITDQVPVQLKLAESAAEIRAAELLAADVLGVLDDRGRRGIKVLPAADRVAQTRDSAHLARLCLRAVERLSMSMGAAGLSEANPVQRLTADVRAIASHAAMQWEASMLPYGKWMLGVKTGDPEIDRVPAPSL